MEGLETDESVAPRHLQEYWLPKIVADPSFLLAHGSTEPRGASDRWLGYDTPETAFQTKAVLKGDEWVINGRKQFVSNGYDAKLLSPMTFTPLNFAEVDWVVRRRFSDSVGIGRNNLLKHHN